MKSYLFLFALLSLIFLSACTGTRNLYSSSLLLSPVPLKKGDATIEGNYFTHSKYAGNDSSQLNHDNCFGLDLFYMLKQRTALIAFADVKNEKDRYHDTISQISNPSFNAGFDSSEVLGKRYVVGGGMVFFSKNQNKTSRSIAISAAFNHFSINESGSLNRSSYRRFFELNQVSVSLQHNLLFTINESWKISWTARLILLNNLKARTDFSTSEKQVAGLRDKSLDVIFSPAAAYLEVKPVKGFPAFVTGQFFNDLNFPKQTLAKYQPGRIYIKGTGIAVGVKCLL